MKNKKLVLTMITGILILVLFQMYAFSRVWFNKGETPFDEPTAEVASMSQYIVQGAGYFLTSYSDVLLLLNKVEVAELKGFDYRELQKIVESAVANMENVQDNYSVLKQMTEATPYQADMIEKLILFDYTGFQKARGLNSKIFGDVQNLLSQGDVKAAFARMLSTTETLLNHLYKIKGMIDAAEFPPITDLWQLNQDYANALLFGQYAAQVFFEISGN